MVLTVKQQEAIEALERYGGVNAAARALGISHTAVRKRLDSAGAGTNQAAPVVTPASGGFALEGRTLLSSKPTDVWKSRFYSLTRGRGYFLEHLADQWGSSVDTIRSKAKRFGALRYVEDIDRPGHYIACIVHPETAKGR